MTPEYVEDPRKEAEADLHGELLLWNTFKVTLMGGVAFVAACGYILFQ